MRTPDSLARERYLEWEELESLMQRKRLRRAEVLRLGVLYRRVVSDLATARRDFPGDPVTTYLEGLAARAHPLVFRGRAPVLNDLGRLFAVEFPRAVRAISTEVALACLVFFGGGLVAFLLALEAPDRFRSFVPDTVMDRILSVGAEFKEEGRSAWVRVSEGARPMTSYAIATNNIRVSLLAFAGGALLGLRTLHVLAFNGILLGLITAFAVHESAIVPLGVFVAAHGPLELTVIALAGAAGLSIGHAFLDPGGLGRLEAVVLGARRGVTIALGGALVLLVAGLIEGFVSPSAAPPWMKIGLGLLSGGAFWIFITRAGRETSAPVGEGLPA